jgi:uncharacterized repeat protein (TIGR03803 family)
MKSGMEETMESKPIAHSITTVLIVLAIAASMVSVAKAANTEQVLYSFAGDTDGEYIDSDLIMDSAGNIYGTSVQGGAFGTGTVFELSPSNGTWTHTVLYSFTGLADGGQPYKGVTLDTKGNLYGAAVVGGSFAGPCVEAGCGVVYKLANNGGTWTQTVIHTFRGGNDGQGPGSGLTFDKLGNLYGMTPIGGANGVGVIFQMKPNANGTWKERVIHTFTGGADGANASAGRLILDSAGNLYGVATAGGVNQQGTAFELSPSPNGTWNFQTLYAFKGNGDAGFPYGALAMDKAGNFYGTTYYDGANNLGSVYQLTNSNGTWSESVLYSFTGGRDGSSPISNLVVDRAGNLWGTTSEGGAGCSCGTIFKMTNANGQWTERVAYRFQSTPDGAFVYNGMIADSAGNLYGATVHGGTNNEGAVYEFTP